MKSGSERQVRSHLTSVLPSGGGRGRSSAVEFNPPAAGPRLCVSPLSVVCADKESTAAFMRQSSQNKSRLFPNDSINAQL